MLRLSRLITSFLLLLSLLPVGGAVFAASLLSDDMESYTSFPSGAWTNASGNGSWSIATDGTKVAKQTSSTSNTYIVTNGQSTWNNYTYSAKVKVGSTSVRNGIVARYVDSNNYYFLLLYNGSVILNKKVNGSTTAIQQTAFAANTTTFYNLKIVVNGTSVQGYVDGVLMVQGTDTGLTAGKVGFYANGIASFDDVLVTDSASTDTQAPTAPTNLAGSAVSSSAINLTWTASTDNVGVTNYDVYRNAALVGSSTGTSYSDTGLSASTTYTYTVKAKDAAGNVSGNSNAISVTTQAGGGGGGGTIVNVSTSAQLQTAINNATAGTTIVLANGTYTNSGNFVVTSKIGTSTNPITIKAANQGSAIISGGAYFIIKTSEYVVIEGLKFTNTGNTAVKLDGSNNIRITRNTFALTENGSSLKWLLIGGTNSHHNRIDHNEFGPKHDLGNFITFDGTAPQITQYDTVEYNYFHDIGPRATNEMEAIRVGVSTLSMSDAFATIQYNLFENADGDPEYVSIKSGHNTVRYNTFLNSEGVLSSRHGHGQSIYGNFFLGDGVKPGVGGIRLYAYDHKVYNNYFEGLTGTGYSNAINVDGGDFDGGSTGTNYTSADLAKHWRVYRAQIVNNTIVNSTTGIVVGQNYTLAPVDSEIANNIVNNSTGTLYNEVKTSNTTFQGNIGFGSTLNNKSRTSAEIANVNPAFTTVNGLQKLSSTSPAINASAGTYSYVTEDMDGQTRSGVDDVGSDEYSTGTIISRPLTIANVGPLAP